MSDQVTKFNARIKRINNPDKIYWTDPETGINVPRRLSKGQIIAHNFQTKQGKVSLVMSVCLGVICLMAARYVRFHMAAIDETGTEALTLSLMDAGLALFMALLIGGFVRLKTFRQVTAQLSGIALMLVAMHNLVWLYPAEFAQVYGQSYVDQVRSLTEPLSIYVNGATIPFGDELAQLASL